MNNKKIKTKLLMIFSALIIIFLISFSSLNIVRIQALLETTENQYNLDSFDGSTWKWTTTEIVSTESDGYSYEPSLALDALGNVHIAWYDFTSYPDAGNDGDIFYKRWNFSTSLWTTTEVVSTESTADSYSPSLAVDAVGNVHIVWSDPTDYSGSGTDEDIFYKRWEASTSSWTTEEVVSTESTRNSFGPSLAIDAIGNVHLAWYDLTDYSGAGTDYDIFYKRWNAYVSTWTTTEVVSTESNGYSGYPSLAVNAGGNVHITWADETNFAGAGTDGDIFYKFLVCSPPAPELAFIVPNPTELTTINLNWNNVLRAINYHVYRSSSYIWSVEGLTPVTSLSSSEFFDTLLSEGFYYYVVVAENFAGNSSHSNCQYIEVSFPDLEAPRLAPILPNPTELTSISLVWDEIDGATEYHVYRSASYIWSVVGLLPIAAVGVNSFVDSLPSEGYYFYVIVANDGVRNSTLSNCEYIEYKLPTLHEFFIISSLIIGLPVLLFVVTIIRKKKSKMS